MSDHLPSDQPYKDLQQHFASCTLCPRHCHANRLAGETGYCGQTAHLRAARAALHMWEEPCISGAVGSGTVFFSGCNLRCLYCQNHDIALGQTGKEISAKHLSEIFLELQQKGAANINLVTPTHYIPLIAYALEQARLHGLSLPVVYNCGGYESVDALQILDGLVDIYLPDLKYVSSELSARYSHAENYFKKAKLALKEMFRQVGKPIFIIPSVRQTTPSPHGPIPRSLWSDMRLLPSLLQTTSLLTPSIPGHTLTASGDDRAPSGAAWSCRRQQESTALSPGCLRE